MNSDAGYFVFLVVVIVLGVIGIFVQKRMLTSIYQKTGKNLSINAFWSIAAFLGLIGLLGIPGIIMGGFEPSMAIVVLVAVIVLAALVIRNVRAAGGLGAALAVVQILCGFFAFFLAIISIVLRVVGVQLNTTNLMQIQMDNVSQEQKKGEKQRAEKAERQEAYAQKTYGMTAQEAWDAGHKEIDPDLLKK